MRISWDEKNGALFISFGDPARYHESREIVPGVVVDFDRKGKALAIELEDAAAVVDPAEITKLVHPRIRSGADLRLFRERLGLTQEQLGDLIEVPRNTIARWEREELPIAKVRQLELSLSAILRPQVQRRIAIVFSDDDGEGWLECGFCGERFELPFGMELRGGKPSHDPVDLIREHYVPGVDDDRSVIKRCRNWHRWKTSPWELRNSDDGKLVERGIVNVSSRGTIEIERATPQSRRGSRSRSSG